MRILSLMRNNPFRTASLILAMVGLALVPLATTGCAPKGEAKPSTDEQEVEVVTINPQRMDLTREIDQPGYLRPYYETAIYTKIPGFALEPKVDKGDWITEGQLLLEIYVPEVKQDLIVKEARVKQAEADQKQIEEASKAAKAGMEAARADIKAKEATIQSTLAQVARWTAEDVRSRRLLKDGIYDQQTADEVTNQLQVSKAQVDEATARWKSSEATFEQASAQYEKSKADIGVAMANVEVAKAAYQQWKDWLSYAEIRAPYDGVVTDRHVNTGDFLQPATSGSTSKSATPVFTVMRTDVMRMTVPVPEIDAGLINTGDLRGYDIQLMSPTIDRNALPTRGKNLIVVGVVNRLLHFRIFDESGKMAVDCDETQVKEQARQIKELRKELQNLWPPHKLIPSESGGIITAVTAIVARTQLGDLATVRFQAKAGDVPVKVGRVTRGSYALDTKARTLGIEVYLDNSDRKLNPGMYANVNIKAKLRNALSLPADSILSDILADGDRSYCYVVEDGRVHKLFLEIGARCDEGVQVLRKQRPGGEWEEFTGTEAVVMDPKKKEDAAPSRVVGPKALQDNQQVQVVKASAGS